MNFRYVSMLAVAGLAAGCNTNLKTPLEQDRGAAIARCMRQVDLWGPSAKSQGKMLTGASEERLPSVVCNRLVRGVESGRITWADVGRMQRGQGTQVFKVLKGQ